MMVVRCPCNAGWYCFRGYAKCCCII